MAKKGNKSGCEGGIASTLHDLVTCELPDLIKATTICVLCSVHEVLNMVTRDAQGSLFCFGVGQRKKNLGRGRGKNLGEG